MVGHEVASGGWFEENLDLQLCLCCSVGVDTAPGRGHLPPTPPHPSQVPLWVSPREKPFLAQLIPKELEEKEGVMGIGPGCRGPLHSSAHSDRA